MSPKANGKKKPIGKLNYETELVVPGFCGNNVLNEQHRRTTVVIRNYQLTRVSQFRSGFGLSLG